MVARDGDSEANRMMVDLESMCKEGEGISGMKSGDRGTKGKNISVPNHGKIIQSHLMEGIVAEELMGGSKSTVNEGIIIMDPKRRRFDAEVGVDSQTYGLSQVANDDVSASPKNVEEVGSGIQAHRTP